MVGLGIGIGLGVTNTVLQSASMVGNELSLASKIGTSAKVGTAAKFVSGTVASIFIVVDVVRLVIISIDSNETEAVKKLREIADDLEK